MHVGGIINRIKAVRKSRASRGIQAKRSSRTQRFSGQKLGENRVFGGCRGASTVDFGRQPKQRTFCHHSKISAKFANYGQQQLPAGPDRCISRRNKKILTAHRY